MGAGTGTHNIDGDGILPKYFCCLGDEFGLVNDTCVANTVVLAAGEKATLVSVFRLACSFPSQALIFVILHHYNKC
jgi:hypothetical protein